LSKHRTIIQEPTFDAQIAILAISHKRLDEVLLGIHISLANHPDKCPKIPGTLLSAVKTRFYPEAPALRIFFTYDEDEVHLHHIEFVGD
jgi:hypothetical protein